MLGASVAEPEPDQERPLRSGLVLSVTYIGPSTHGYFARVFVCVPCAPSCCSHAPSALPPVASPQTQLHTLDVGSNRIERISDLEALVNLREFWVNNNRLSCFDNLATLAVSCPHLATIYLEGNPLALAPDYAARALDVLPIGLTQLDALPVEVVRRRLGEGPVATLAAGIGRLAAPRPGGVGGGAASERDGGANAMAPG